MSAPESGTPRIGPLRNLIASIGAAIIYALIRLFGRRVAPGDAPWLMGPLGGPHIGDKPFDEYAAAHGLVVVRKAPEGGLIPRFEALRGPTFDPAAVAPQVRDFYEHTAAFRMDVWAKTFFPSNLALWLLVTTISRKVDQLNFPVDTFATASGMDSEIVLLQDAQGEGRWTGWFRRLVEDGRVLYTGFYTSQVIPSHMGACVKVVFPMPNGNATVILRPEVGEGGALILDSDGAGFGNVGFYRMQRFGRGDALTVWKIRSLKERFRVYVDAEGVLRCDHAIRFLGFPVLHLHYRIQRKG